MKEWILLPFLVQIVAMFFDEFYFHYRRGLPRWERIGHPLDTLTMLACFGWIYFQPLSPFAIKVYLGLALFSMIFVTKDEWVHTRSCEPGENWLHALLYLTHPLSLMAAFLMWPSVQPGSVGEWATLVPLTPFLTLFFKGLLVATLIYCLYQIVYWNFLWRGTVKSTTRSTTP